MYLQLLSFHCENQKYFRIYSNLISKALSRKELSGYSEKHHILPYCMGGPNTKDNFVRLTSREHFIAHLILLRMVNPYFKYKMARALLLMNQVNKSSKTYSEMRSIITEKMTGPNNQGFGKPGVNLGRKFSDETKAKMAAAKLNKKHSEETKKKISETLSNREFSPEHKANLSKANTGRKHTEESKAKISAHSKKQIGPNKGKKMSEEIKAKISASVKKTKSLKLPELLNEQENSSS